MLCFPRHRCRAIEFAPRLEQLEGIKQMPTLVALISPCVLIRTKRTGAFHETICQEALVCLAVRLCGGLLLQITVLVEFRENVLRDVGLLGRGCAAEMIEGDVEPFIDVGVQCEVLIA